MEGRKLDTTIVYQPNCHYNISENSHDITLPLRTPKMDINIPINQYYGDPLEISIFISDVITNEAVGWGSVTFYYIDENDITRKRRKINQEPIAIDKNGNASIKYIPHSKNGTIEVDFEGEPYYHSITQQDQFLLIERPTRVEFTKYAPYLTNPEDTIELSVKVKDAITNEPLDYGLVTFLNYSDFNIDSDGYEKVIGNPVYLNENGVATIKYSPIQLETNDLFHNNFELIRAVYNYNNTQYGVTWKYYKSHSDYTSVAIRRSNKLNISTPKKGVDYSELICDKNGLFSATSTDSLHFQCEVNIPNIVVNQADIYFVVTGEQIVYTNDGEEKISFNQKYKAYSINDNRFECNNIKLPYGQYRVYATIDNAKTTINEDVYDIPCDVNTPPITNITQNKDNTNQNILDGLYLQSSESESFYINIAPLSSDLELSLNFSQPIMATETLNINDLVLTIGGENITNIDKSILDNKKCFFWFSNLNKTYEGVIKNNNGVLQGKLKNNIQISNVGDYTCYAYIIGDIYTNGTYTQQYGTTYSNNIVLKRRNMVELNLRVDTTNNIYPANIKYILSASNILAQDIINVDIKIYKTGTPPILISSHDLTNINSQVNGFITGYDASNYTLKAEITTAGYTHITSEINIEILKADLKMSLNNISKNINTAIQNDIIIGLEHSNDDKIGDININKLSGTVRPKNDTETEHNTVISIKKITDTYYSIINTARIFANGDWEIKINYAGDKNYNAISTDWFSFKAFSHDPECINVMYDPNGYKMTNQVVYWIQSGNQSNTINDDTLYEITGNYYTISQYVLVISKLFFANEQEPFKKIVSITNNMGIYDIGLPTITNDDFSNINIIKYDIDPNNDILNIFSEANTVNNAYQQFKTFFTSYALACSENEIKALYNQAKENHFKSLFLGYGKVQNKYMYF